MHGDAAAMTKLNVTSQQALTQYEPWRTPDWQRLWLAAQVPGKAWRSLALVPAGPGAAPEISLQIAVTLAHTGMVHLGVPIHVADGTRVSLAELVPFSEEIERYTAGTELILIALSAVSDNVTSVSLAQAADRSLLCVLLGQMSIADSKQTLLRIGRDRFLGSVVFRPARRSG